MCGTMFFYFEYPSPPLPGRMINLMQGLQIANTLTKYEKKSVFYKLHALVKNYEDL